MKIIVIRHSDRELIKNSETAHLAQLTPNGINKAITFGKQLNEKFDIKLDNIFTSYVERCVDTGKLIQDSHLLGIFPEGNVKFYVPETDNNLVSLGYIKLHRKIEVFDYLAKMFEKSEWDYPGMFQELFNKNLLIHENCADFSKEFLSNYYFPFHNNLVVTHDIIISPIMHFLSETFNFTMESYMFQPRPLSGFCLYRENGREIVEWINFEEEIKITRLF